MNYQIGDLLLGKHGGKVFMIKKVIEIERFTGKSRKEITMGYRIAPTDNLGYDFAVAHDELHERFHPFTMEKK